MEIVYSSISFKHPSRNAIILEGFDYRIVPGKIIGICGENMSHIMKMLAFLLLPSNGSIMIDGTLIERGKELDQKIGYVPDVAIFMCDTVEKELEQAYFAYHTKEDMTKKIKEVCKMSLLSPSLLSRHPATLSMTQKKKLMLAKTLLQNPDIYFLEDFPRGFSYQEQEYYKKLFRKLSQNYHKTIVISSHQTDFFLNIVDEMLVFAKKKLLYQGDKSLFYQEEIYQYIDCPEIVSCIFYLRSKGHSIPNYYEVKELLKAIYRDVT